MNIIEKLYVFVLKRLSDKKYILYLRKKGINIGKNTKIFKPQNTIIDLSRPCLLEIGDYCKITSGVVILTHDYSRSVLRMAFGDIIGEAQKTKIGNNVFIGMNSIILMGATIGNNVIIGAGSVVTGDVPDNVIIAGNPAKIIRTIEEQYKIRKSKFMDEAANYVKYFQKHNNRLPTINELGAFYPLFLERNIKVVEKYNLKIKLSGDNYEDIQKCFLATTPVFSGYEDFIDYCNTSEI